MTAPGWTNNQETLMHELRLYGHGLHIDKRVSVHAYPEHVGYSIVFRCIRGGQQLVLLSAPAALCLGQPLCTTPQNVDGWHVRIVEHLLIALLTCQIGHTTVEVDAEEVPILDGSVQPWLQAIETCGRLPLDAPKRFLQILRTVAVEDGGMYRMIIEPANHYAISVINDLKGFDEINWQGIINPVSFTSDIAPSCSYGRLRWAVPAILFGYLRSQPILCGTRPPCTATIVGPGVIGGMRLPMEFVRHCVFDLIGDLALLGASLLGKVTTLCLGHEMSYRLCAALLARSDAWEWTYSAH